MSRKRVVIDGIYQWVDEGPAFAARFIPRGSFVSGDSGPNQKERERFKVKNAARLTANQSRLDDRPVKPGRPKVYATDEERDAARRASWAKSQAKYRARRAA